MNSPVTRIDEAGTESIWWRLIEDYCFGFIHLAVQMHIVLHNPGIGMEKAVYNNEDKKCGRADIFNLKTGEVWELKTVRTGAEAAALQVEKYCGNHLKDSDKKLTKGMSGRFLDYFYLQCGIDIYMVTYSTPQDGVILYHVKKCRLAQEEAYAEYVPIPQRTPERKPTIGGIPAYGVARTAVGVGAFAFAYFAFGRGGGGIRSFACPEYCSS